MQTFLLSSMLLLASVTLSVAQECNELVINDYSNGLGPSNVNGAHHDENTISSSTDGKLEVKDGKLVILTPSDAASFYFIDFANACLDVSAFDTVEMSIKSAEDVNIAFRFGGDCATFQWQVVRLKLSDYHALDDTTKTIQIPFNDITGLNVNKQLHSVAFEFPAGAQLMELDDIKLINSTCAQKDDGQKYPAVGSASSATPETSGATLTVIEMSTVLFVAAFSLL